jgi:hypothetical protein
MGRRGKGWGVSWYPLLCFWNFIPASHIDYFHDVVLIEGRMVKMNPPLQDSLP